jgi:uncharacterized protein (UPF0335 family)
MSTPSESRLDRIERLLESQAAAAAESQRDFTARTEVLRVNIESLHASVSELYATAQRDGENIRALAHIAEIHERRLADIEGGTAQ